jgi:hypothetical protein
MRRTWPDYVIALLGSIVGAYLIGWLVVRWALEYQPGNLLLAVLGPILLIPLGSAGGTTLSLALFRRHSPVLTGILTLPVTIAVGIVVVVLSRFIDTMDYGWLIIIPPLIAPLGARFIVLGRKPNPREPQPWLRLRDWPIRRVLGYAIPILLVTLAALLFVNWLDGRDTDVAELAAPGPRACECELLTEWVESLAILPEGDSFRASNFRVTELLEGFVVVASQYVGDDVNADYYRTVFSEAGFTGVQILDQPELWSATFFDRDTRSESPWIVDVALLDSHVDITIRVKADGSEWGITSTDQLWELYTSNREKALEVQRERQARAIDILEPVERAIQGA